MSDGGIDKAGLFVHFNTTAPQEKSMSKLFSLKGRTAIITGASAAGGIGYAVARAYAEHGANVAIWWNSRKDAPERSKAIEADFGVKSKAYQVDVTKYDQVEKAVAEVAKDFNGRIDIFVANAGTVWTKGAAIDAPLEHYEEVERVDLDGVFYCLRAVGPYFRRQKFEGTDLNGNKLENFTYGSFVATASMSGHIVNYPQLQATYNASKAGVIHLCKSFAVEWVKFARVNTISPGYIATELGNFVPEETKKIWRSKIPMGREAEPHELAGGFLYLASDAASYTTGADLIIDGGYCAP